MSTFKHLSVETLASMMEGGSPVVVDIRDALSYQQGHIEDAQLLDNDSIHSFMGETDKSASVVVCCYHGNSSQSAAAFLCQQDFQDVYSLDGGFEGWRAAFPDRVSR